MTTYVLGDDLYDESFSIDTPAGDFLGEYGVGVSETIGVGDPKKVTALEIWLFDKNDIKTATKVLMSAHAFGDAAIRGRLEAKGELIQVEPQKQVMLETETLQLLATVVDLQYGDGSMPDKSYFDRVTWNWRSGARQTRRIEMQQHRGRAIRPACFCYSAYSIFRILKLDACRPGVSASTTSPTL